MKRFIPSLALLGALSALPASSAELIEIKSNAANAERMKRRTAEYDYDVPAPGSYTLPAVQPATDGMVLGTNGASMRLHDLMRGRVVVLSFIYTRCTDPKACMRATGVLSELQRLTRQQPGLAEKLLLLTLSFDPAHDTPGVMARYGRVSLAHTGGADWLFITTRTAAELQPLLEGYGQRVDRRKTFSAMGPYYHPLRVYLIDQRQQVRNIYSYGLLDPRLVVTDAQTLIMEAAAQAFPSRSRPACVGSSDRD